jgi:tripartite-type tricarboxylate transporter receptor subunit TctC
MEGVMAWRTLLAKTIGPVWVAAGLCLPAHAQFYANKNLTIVVNFGAGGNADISARIFQKYLANHIAGKPNIVIQNVPGAGGFQAMNMLGLGINYRPDGLTAGFFGLSFPGMIVQDPAAKVSMDDFAVIGAVRDWNIAYARKDAAPGINKPEDVAKVTEIYAGGYGRGDSNDMRSSLSLEIIGAHYKSISGFQGTSDLNKAMLQNEINFVNSALPAYLNQAVPQLIKPGIAIPLFYFPVSGQNGELAKVSALERLGIPSFPEVYQKVYGKMPSGTQFDALLLMCDLDSAMHGTIVLPKGSPPEAVAALRSGFDDLAKDTEFLDAYAKISGEHPQLSDGVALQPLLDRLHSVSPDVKKVFKDMMGE